MTRPLSEIEKFWRSITPYTRPVGAFWKRRAPDGTEYLLGRIGRDYLVIRTNPQKQTERSPDYWVLCDRSFPMTVEQGAAPYLPAAEVRKAAKILRNVGAQDPREPDGETSPEDQEAEPR